MSGGEQSRVGDPGLPSGVFVGGLVESFGEVEQFAATRHVATDGGDGALVADQRDDGVAHLSTQDGGLAGGSVEPRQHSSEDFEDLCLDAVDGLVVGGGAGDVESDASQVPVWCAQQMAGVVGDAGGVGVDAGAPHGDVAVERVVQVVDLVRVRGAGQGGGELGLPAGGGVRHVRHGGREGGPGRGDPGRVGGEVLPHLRQVGGDDGRCERCGDAGGALYAELPDGPVETRCVLGELVPAAVAGEVLVGADLVLPRVDDTPVGEPGQSVVQVQLLGGQERGARLGVVAQLPCQTLVDEVDELVVRDAGEVLGLVVEHDVDDEPVHDGVVGGGEVGRDAHASRQANEVPERGCVLWLLAHRSDPSVENVTLCGGTDTSARIRP